MLRKHLKDRILDIVGSSPLTEYAFEVGFTDTGLRVGYRLNPKFFFAWGSDDDGAMSVLRCPGEDLLLPQSEKVYSIENAIPKLEEWLRWVEVEDGIPEDSDRFTDLKQKIFKIIGEKIGDEDKFFTHEEADELDSRVQELERKFAEMLTASQAKDSEILAMKTILGQARSDIGKMTKRKWKVVGAGKLVNVLVSLFKTKEVRSLAIDEVRKLMDL